MANTYFQFKQFLINQEKSGMKVTTDGCLFGAWVASQIRDSEPKHILDIGTGTGLLSLMVAQARPKSVIHALEINESAYHEAVDNFKNSNWNIRLKCIHTSLQGYESEKKFELIICNPPFFANNPKGNKLNKNQAIHSDSLPPNDLIKGVFQNLEKSGVLYLLYPEREMIEFVALAKQEGLHLYKQVIVRNKKDSPIFRMMCGFSFTPSDCIEDEIIIRDEKDAYTSSFWSLLEPYYL